MDNIIAWMSSTTGLITTITTFMVAILLLIENSNKLVFKPLSRIAKFLFGWLGREDRERVRSLEDKITKLIEHSEERDDKIIDMMETSHREIYNKIDTNERDRIRTEIFSYGRIARAHEFIGIEEWRHIQDIYYKYHEVLNGNGQVTDEYNYIREYYYTQFENKNVEE